MKTRPGFVSNSSSSNFTLVTTKEVHETALSLLSTQAADIIRQIAGIKKIGSTEVVVVACYFSDNGRTYNRIGQWRNCDNKPQTHDFIREGDQDLASIVHEYCDALNGQFMSGAVED